MPESRGSVIARIYAFLRARTDHTVYGALLFAVLLSTFVLMASFGESLGAAFFHALQMTVLNYDGDLEGHWLATSTISLLKILMPGIASWAIIRTYMNQVVKLRDWRSDQRRKDHVVVIGDGAIAVQVAKQHAKQDKNAKIILIAPGEISSGSVDAENILVRRAKIFESDALRTYGLTNAKVIYLASESDETNIRVLGAVQSLFREKGIESFEKVLIHTTSQMLANAVRSSERHPRIRTFNVRRRAARLLIEQYETAPDGERFEYDRSVKTPPHVLVAGNSPFAGSVLEQLIRMGHYAYGLNARVSLIGHDGESLRAALVDRVPALSIDSREWTEQEMEYLPLITIKHYPSYFDFFKPTDEHAELSVCYVFGTDVDEQLRLLELILRQTVNGKFKIIVVDETSAVSGEGANPIQGIIERYGISRDRIRYFNVAEKGTHIASNEFHIGEFEEAEAALINAYFCDQDGAVRRMAKPLAIAIRTRNYTDEECRLMKVRVDTEWFNAEEWARDSSRDAIRHLTLKQRFNPSDLTEKQLNAERASMEHRRWAAERLILGWRYNVVKQTENFLHSSLCGFDALPQSEKEKDDDLIAISEIIANARSPH